MYRIAIRTRIAKLQYLSSHHNLQLYLSNSHPIPEVLILICFKHAPIIFITVESHDHALPLCITKWGGAYTRDPNISA